MRPRPIGAQGRRSAEGPPWQYPRGAGRGRRHLIDFTDYIGDEHSYFDPEDLGRENAAALTAFFERSLNGWVAEEGLAYRPDTNTYRIG